MTLTEELTFLTKAHIKVHQLGQADGMWSQDPEDGRYQRKKRLMAFSPQDLQKMSLGLVRNMKAVTRVNLSFGMSSEIVSH